MSTAQGNPIWVCGPGSAIDGHLAVFDGPSGELLKDGGPAGGGGGAPAWGTITGTLSAQTDLQTALNAKVTSPVNWGTIAGTLSAQTDLQAALNAKISQALFWQVLSPTPTSANTGLTTWLNQGTASVADNPTGLTISDPGNTGGDRLHCRTKAAPATPYTITALVSVSGLNGNFSFAGIGWYDGSLKLHTIGLNGGSNGMVVNVIGWASTTSYGAGFGGSQNGNGGIVGLLVWLRIKDDGTNVSLAWSMDGSYFSTIQTIAKSSGYLGSSGYSNVAFLIDPQAQTNSQDMGATILSWSQTSP